MINHHTLPTGFTYVTDPRIVLSLDYLGSYNFMGRPIASYQKRVCILSSMAAEALMKVQDLLDNLKQGYHLKIFDAYRSQSAVNDFIQWATDPADQLMKADFYPDFNKPELFTLGYIGAKSSHTRGSTVDLTITKQTPGSSTYVDLDMGTPFDFFGEKSHTDFPDLPPHVKANRLLLKQAMEAFDFEPYPQEWCILR